MRNFNIKRQINKLYTLTTVSYFRIVTDWNTGEYFSYRKQLF